MQFKQFVNMSIDKQQMNSDLTHITGNGNWYGSSLWINWLTIAIVAEGSTTPAVDNFARTNSMNFVVRSILSFNSLYMRVVRNAVFSAPESGILIRGISNNFIQMGSISTFAEYETHFSGCNSQDFRWMIWHQWFSKNLSGNWSYK